jgi:PAS domain S-box-containing protein
MKTMPRWLQANLALVLLISLAGGAWFYRGQEKQIHRQVEDGLVTIAQLKAGQINEWRANQLFEADELTADGFLAIAVARWLFNPRIESPENILRRFRSLQRHYHYHDVLLTNPAGQVQLSLSGATGIGHVEVLPELADALRERKSILTDLHVCSISALPHIGVIVPIYSGGGSGQNPIGAVILVIDAHQFLYPLIQSWPAPSKTAETLLVRRDGNSVLFLNDLRHRSGAALKFRISLNQGDVPAVMAVLGKNGIVNGTDYRGVRVISAIRPIANSTWFLIAKVDTTEAFAEWYFRSIAIVGLLLVVLVLEGTTVILIWQRNEKAHFRSLYESESARRAVEERFRVVAESLSDVIYEWDLAERVDWFGNIDELMGYEQGAFPRTLAGWAATLHPEDCDRVMSAVDGHLRGKAPYSVEYRIRKKDGNYAYWTARGKVILDSYGKAVRWIGAITDITERKQAEEALHASQSDLSLRDALSQVLLTATNEEMYSAVLRVILEGMNSAHGVFGYLDEQGSLVIPSMTRHVWDKCQVPDKSIIFPRQTWGNSSWSRAILEKRSNYSNQISKLVPEGHIDIRRNMSVPILFRDEVIGLLQVANKEADYTSSDLQTLEFVSSFLAPVLDARLKRDRLDEARQHALADLERSNKELEQFAYVASHDLQEPLRTVSSYAQLLAKRYEGQLDRDAQDFIGYLVDGASRMQRLIQDLLAYARITTRGSLFVEIDLYEALGEAVLNLQAAITESEALVTNGDLPCLKGDLRQLVQVFQNLIGNAIKFRKKEEPPRIHVSAENSGLEWIISVKDNGIGIDPQYFNRLFIVFQRLHGKQEYSGTGIGLAICQRIVQRHGGRIWAESVPGDGSTFRFSLKA